MVHRFVHLSDIHFGQEKKDGSRITHDAVRKALVADVAKMAAKRGRASRVLVTGDIAYAGKQTEYHTAAEWLEALTDACQCKNTEVSTIPGNHDCDLTAINNHARITYAQLRASPDKQAIANFNGIVEDGEAGSPFLPKLKTYREFASGFGSDFESGARPCWTRSFELPGGVTLRFHGLTSVQVSNLEDALHKLMLGNQQYTIDEENNVINIVLCHHPLDWFIDESEAANFLQNRARVLMFGHEHVPNGEKQTNAYTVREWLVLNAGAVSPPEVDYTYSYNWLELSCVEENGAHHLVIEIFPRVWVQARVEFDADRQLLAGADESVKVRILCPNVKMSPLPDTTQPKASASAGIPADSKSSAPSNGDGLIEKQGGLPMDVHSADFDRLRYLFWRYLDWRQRLKVLVEADALPQTAEEPIPQTMERKALEMAASTPGTLHELWDAVMPFIPEGKREQNPFKPKP